MPTRTRGSSTLDAEARAAIAEALAGAPRGERTATARRLAAHYHVSLSTVYAHAGVGGPPRKRKLSETSKNYRQWVREIVVWRHQGPKPIPYDQAVRAAVDKGALSVGALEMPIPTIRRVVRELGLRPRAKRTHWLWAEYPMQVVLLDASTSEHLVVDGVGAGEGDAARLALHRKPTPSTGYKNKPLPPDRRRVLVYGLWDRCSGVYRSRYCVARGETSLDALEFLCWALARSPDPRVVLHGVPDQLWADQGPLVKSAPADDLLARLKPGPDDGPGIEVHRTEPYEKEGMGGVERPHRTRWERFERQLFLRRQRTLTLGELNARLQEYEIEENGRRLSRTPVDGRLLTRTATWVALANRRPADRPLRELPENPLETLSRVARRRVDQRGIVRWGGVFYESEDWHDRSVIARRAADGSGDLMLEDVLEDDATGERRTARRLAAPEHGDVVRQAPASPLERLLAEEGERTGADIYAPQPAPGVVPMPARTAAAAPLENPLAGADRCRDLEAAVKLFVELYPHPLAPGRLAEVRAHFERAGLRRQAVVDLAQTLLAARRSA